MNDNIIERLRPLGDTVAIAVLKKTIKVTHGMKRFYY
jgi:hypothetical protein